jgi:AraC-like DNA-binding protein/Flp pilus assembly pilin Flp
MASDGPVGEDRDTAADGGEPAVIAAAATGIVDYIDRLGGDIDTIFGNSGIAPESAGSTTLKLRLADFCTLFEEASKRTGYDNFGLWFGNQFQPRDLGLWGYAAISAPTLGSALETLVGLFRYHQESSVMRFVRDTDGFVRIEYRIEAPDILERRQDAELSLGMFLNVVRECCGMGWSPEEVHFEHPRPPGFTDHERAFGAPVYFAQNTNALLFRPDILERRMPACDLRLMTMMRSCLIELADVANPPLSLFDSVRSAIRHGLPQGCPTLESVCRDLRITPTAVHRALSLEGVAFKDLIEATRRELAMSYLRQRHLPISEIALLLGYSELSAFSRAVRRWTGTSPTLIRRRMLGGG